MKERMIQIRLAADPTVGPVRDILDATGLSDGEKIEQLLGILGSILEVVDDHFTQASQTIQARNR